MSNFISSQGGQAQDFSSSPGGQAQDVVSMEDHLMTVPGVAQLEALPSLSATELVLLGGARRDFRFTSSRGASTSNPRDSPIWGVPESSPRIAQAQDAVNILDGSSPSSRPRPRLKLKTHAAAQDQGRRRPRMDSSHRNGLTHRPGGS
jgi:hypothetical protein